MPLCRPKTKTPALLAACRANARKGTGPRTAEGKCRSRLNALKHGRYSPNFRENLVQAGRETGVKRFDFIRSHVLKFLPPVTQQQKREADELARRIWCWAEKKDRIGRKQRSSMDSANYHTTALPFFRLQIRDRSGRTLVSVTVGYQRRRAGEGQSLARVALTLTPGKGSSIYQEQQAMWRSAWVLSKMPVLMTGARPVPKSFKELQQAINERVAAPPVTAWRPEVMIWLRPVRYREGRHGQNPLPRSPRQRSATASRRKVPVAAAPPPPSAGRRPTAPARSKVDTKVSPKAGWLQKLLGLFRRKRDEPERPARPEPPDLAATEPDGEALRPSLDDPPLDRGYGKDFCRVLDYAECSIALLAGRNRGASASPHRGPRRSC
ncbi:MAG TPA: hypothetical protein VKM93_13570 [Terriglobia bacterium]|nr:hypothetical protein [Terriglobia bacterium]